jgi:hypothetical protein
MKVICESEEVTKEIADTLVSKVENCKVDGVYAYITKSISIEILNILQKKLLSISIENNQLYQFENDENANFAHFWVYCSNNIIYLFEKQPSFIHYITDFPQNYTLKLESKERKSRRRFSLDSLP